MTSNASTNEMTDTRDLLFEIGCEELPASFVAGALEALPRLAIDRLNALRLDHGDVKALGTPRRLTLIVEGLATEQPNLTEQVQGPPVKAAFKDGQPTKAAEAFANKLGCGLDDLERVETPKGEYLVGTRREEGRPARELLPETLAEIVTAIPFRKSMRWGEGEITFGRPLRWLAALLGDEPLRVSVGDLESAPKSYGHRFLHPGPVALDGVQGYVEALAKAHVVVDPAERGRLMVQRLHAAAEQAGGALIEDAFLISENLSLVEDPQVVVGSFDEVFLELPEEVILEVARGHQRYFGVRGADGKLLPKYLAVVNTAEHPDKIKLGNDRVMRARLADAQFFHAEDLKRPLVERRKELDGIVFQNRLGSVLDKAQRIEALAGDLGRMTDRVPSVVEVAQQGAHLCKCDLVTWMVGEFPELQGEVGRAYAVAQGVAPEVAEVIADHYAPKGASDATASSEAGSLVAMADRIDSLVGCFAIGLSPTGGADPYGLRRACIGTLRTLLDRNLDLTLGDAFAAAYRGYDKVDLDLEIGALTDKLGGFFRDRLRGILSDGIPTDVVDAALGVAADRPVDARQRARAILAIDAETRAKVGEVFKRATNIAREAPEGDPEKGAEPAETALYEAFFAVKEELGSLAADGDYEAAFRKLAELAAPLGTYFDEVLVMADDEAIKNNRLRLMRVISETCGSLAQLELLGSARARGGDD